MNKICFIIVNYNNSNDCILFYKNILQSFKILEFKILVIDNNSFEDDFQNLSSKLDFGNVTIIKSNQNIGYFPALNLGISSLKNLYDYDLIYVGNNDISFSSNFENDLINMYNIVQNEFVISPSIFTIDGVNQNPHLEVDFSKIKLFLFELYYGFYFFSIFFDFLSKFKKKVLPRNIVNSSFPRHILEGHGSAYFLTRNYFSYYKLLPNNIFLYHEERALSILLNRNNHKIFFYPFVKLFHREHSTTSLVLSKERWKLKRQSFFSNKIYLNE